MMIVVMVLALLFPLAVVIPIEEGTRMRKCGNWQDGPQK